MTSTQIRQSFLDFFQSKQHTIVPSSSLMPDSPNLLFTNAGMNQFVPIFLGQTRCPYTPGRAADTQKCIRAGGKHNDLDDVGLDTYHHTFFEMLGNWSFGDYFKKEAIDWAWELVVGVWKFPPQRLYATVFCPESERESWNQVIADIAQMARLEMGGAQVDVGGPSTPVGGSGIQSNDALKMIDTEAALFWAKRFLGVGLDPTVHVVPGNKKDNFWMMGETGPCGPCSELHVDLTPAGDTKGALVNKGDARCIEIWNLVFIQFNANPDSTFSPLPAKHVDTGMGFERVTSIIQGTKGFTDFAHAKISNYETDIFRPIFDAIEKLSGKRYGSTLPKAGSTGDNEQEKIDVAFRVIADHIRTLSFAIADGIQPGNTDRNYVLRRILRRAVRYGRTLGFHEPFFYKLVDVLGETMGDVFPEICEKKKHVQDVIRTEEEAFSKTLETGLEVFEFYCGYISRLETRIEIFEVELELCIAGDEHARKRVNDDFMRSGPIYAEPLSGRYGADVEQDLLAQNLDQLFKFLEFSTGVVDSTRRLIQKVRKRISGVAAFTLYDTYGFPLDLTELMARERGLTVDKEGFEKLMEEQRARARAAQKREVVKVAGSYGDFGPTKFIGYDQLDADTGKYEIADNQFVTEWTPLFPETGGQVGDSGWIETMTGTRVAIINTIKGPQGIVIHVLESPNAFDRPNEDPKRLIVNRSRRESIQRHHTVTHLLHWALHEVVNKEASQKGSFVGPDKLTFDFNSAPLTPGQVADVEKLVNERIVENAVVSWTEVPYADVKSRKDVMQFFGDKYGDTVRVVQIGGHAQKLDGYSMELCGGTHTRATGEIGLFRLVGENAIAAGVRRIEAVAGLEAYRRATDEVGLIKTLAGKVNSPVHELEKKIEALLAHQKELERSLKAAIQRNAAQTASWLLTRAQEVNGVSLITQNFPESDADYLQAVVDALKGKFKGVVVLGGSVGETVALVASVSAEFTARIQAGKIIQQIAPIVGGKGGGRPDNARGGGRDAGRLDEALGKVSSLM